MFELSNELCWEQRRLSGHLSQMHRRGLVEREDCLSDRRGAFVVLAAVGTVTAHVLANLQRTSPARR